MPAPPARYKVLRPLGRGGMGTLAVAWDRELEREVALKTIHLDLTPKLRNRFANEARVLAKLRAPQLPEIYDFDADSDPPWITMELIVGKDLDQSPPLDPLATYFEVATGLAVLHAAGVVHRDIKPANILQNDAGRVVLVDFGLALSTGNPRLTKSGMLVGTPLFMAPELLADGDATPASDLYAWGISLFFALEGRFPFGMSSVLDSETSVELAPQFEKVGLDHPARQVLERCLAQDPARRPTGIVELRQLRNAPQRRPPSSEAEGRRTQVLPATEPKPETATRNAAPVSSSFRLSGPRSAALAVLVAGSVAGVFAFLSAPSPSETPPAPAETPDVGVPSFDLAGEFERAVTEKQPSGESFSGLYNRRGVGAYLRLAGFQAWMSWLDRGGSSAALSPEALLRIAAVNRVARDHKMVEPFAGSWIRTTYTEPLTSLLRTTGASKRALELLAVDQPTIFPGFTTRPPPLIAPKTQLAWVLEEPLRDPQTARQLDSFLEPYRRAWLRHAAAGARALDQVPPEERATGRQELVLDLEHFRYAMFGAASGGTAQWVLGRRSVGPEDRALELDIDDILGELASAGGREPARPPAARARRWAELIGQPGVDVDLAREAWIKAMRIARGHGSDELFREFDRAHATRLEAGLSAWDKTWLADRRSRSAAERSPQN